MDPHPCEGDFAGYFVHVVGNPLTAGEAYHITSGESLTWDMIHRLQAEALGKEIEIIHLPVEFIARHAPDMAPGLLGDKAWSVVFDTSKIEALAGGFRPQIPFFPGEFASPWPGMRIIRIKYRLMR